MIRKWAFHSMATRENGRWKRRRVRDVRPASIPPTRTSETFRSTVLTPSLTVSVALLRATNEVEKARGAKPALMRLVVLMAVRVRKDILWDTFGIEEMGWIERFEFEFEFGFEFGSEFVWKKRSEQELEETLCL